MKKTLLAFAAGGTAGHVYPALSLLMACRSKGLDVLMITDKRGAVFVQSFFKAKPHQHAKPQASLSQILKDVVLPCEETQETNTSGLVRSELKLIACASPFVGGFWDHLHASGMLFVSVVSLFFSFLLRRPSCIVAFGGYPSFPPLIVAKILRIPYILHEQNSVMGRVNRLFAKQAYMVATAFPHVRHTHGNMPLRFVGNPLKESFFPFLDVQKPHKEKQVLLVFGGSQGSCLLSQTLAEALCLLPKALQAHMIVLHQVPQSKVSAVTKVYAASHLEAVVSSFIYDMPTSLLFADFTVTRAGATSVHEILAMGRAALFVPLGASLDQDQLHNAAYVASNEAGFLLEEKDYDTNRLAAFLEEILTDGQRRNDMESKAKALWKRGAVAALLAGIEEVLAGSKARQPKDGRNLAA